MKYIYNAIVGLVLLLSFVDFSKQQNDHAAFIEKMRASRDECVKETGVDKDLPIKALHDGQFPDDNNLKCYFKCMYQKMGQMDDKGNIDFSPILEHLPPAIDKAKATDTLNKCKDKKSDDLCQTAFDFAKCMREAVGPIKHD